VAYLFLRQPPAERVPIPDLRTLGNEHIDHPSPDLLDTIYLCQRRQAWYRDWARSVGEEPRDFIGSASLDSPVEGTAAALRHALGFDLDARRDCPTWTEALRHFIAQADDLGVLVMVSGVAGSNANVFIEAKRRHYGMDFCPAFWGVARRAECVRVPVQHREGW
jgi:hypothetical protein